MNHQDQPGKIGTSTRAVQALIAAQHAAQQAANTSDATNARDESDDERSELAEEFLWTLIDSAVTFAAILRAGASTHIEICEDARLAVDLIWHLRDGCEVSGGLLFAENHAKQRDLGIEGKIHDWVDRFREQRVDCIVVWHVIGAPRVHLAYTRKTDSEAVARLIDEVLEHTAAELQCLVLRSLYERGIHANP